MFQRSKIMLGKKGETNNTYNYLLISLRPVPLYRSRTGDMALLSTG